MFTLTVILGSCCEVRQVAVATVQHPIVGRGARFVDCGVCQHLFNAGFISTYSLSHFKAAGVRVSLGLAVPHSVNTS